MLSLIPYRIEIDLWLYETKDFYWLSVRRNIKSFSQIDDSDDFFKDPLRRRHFILPIVYTQQSMINKGQIIGAREKEMAITIGHSQSTPHQVEMRMSAIVVIIYFSQVVGI